MYLCDLCVWYVFVEVKQAAGNRLSHIPCQQAVLNTAGSGEFSRVEVSPTNNGYPVTAAENIGQHSTLGPAAGWPRAASASSVARTCVPQTELSSSLQSAGMAAAAAVSSQSSAFHSSQHVPLSGLSHTSNLQIPSQPFAGYPDVSTQLQSSAQNQTNLPATSLVRFFCIRFCFDILGSAPVYPVCHRHCHHQHQHHHQSSIIIVCNTRISN